MPKTFGIGLSRTGTASLTSALQLLLSTSSVHWPRSMLEILKHDIATDITVACRYKILDQIFPNSKFILTVRDKDAWLKSVIRHYSSVAGIPNLPEGERQFALEADILIYGKIIPTPLDFEITYHRHIADVKNYFKDRPTDLLIMDIAAGDGWDKLSNFFSIDKKIEIPFPWENKCKNG